MAGVNTSQFKVVLNYDICPMVKQRWLLKWTDVRENSGKPCRFEPSWAKMITDMQFP